MYSNPELEKKIYAHEGIRQWVYFDSLGNATIAIGRCIAHGNEGISVDEAFYLLRNDIDKCYRSLSEYVWFKYLNDVRQGVLIELCFNIGLGGLLEFQGMIHALEAKDYATAAKEMLASRWATQVHQRANDMAAWMEKGSY
jgi:lysozyme